MLLDGYVILGQLLDGQAEQPKYRALAKLAETLADPAQWHEAPAKADELARQVLRFWDEHLGVFTVDGSDSLSARSKVFCEVATAMWVSRQNDKGLPTWIRKTIPYYDAQGVISLAQGLDPRVGTVLLDLGETDPMATLAVGNAVLSGARQPVAAELDRLLEQLIRHSMNIESGDSELPERMNRPGVNALDSWQKRKHQSPKSWTLTEVLCALELPAELRPVRDRAIVDLNLAAPYEDIARATAVLVNARVDDRALIAEELKRVQAVVGIDLPEREEPVRAGRRRLVVGTSNTPLGLSIVAELATEHLDELDEGSDRKLFRSRGESAFATASTSSLACERLGLIPSTRRVPTRSPRSAPRSPTMGRTDGRCCKTSPASATLRLNSRKLNGGRSRISLT